MLTELIQGFSVELATTLIAASISTYTFMGGLGSTFYVHYFNTGIIMIIMLVFVNKVFYDPLNNINPLGASCMH